MVALTIPFVVLAVLVDWLLYHDMASHRENYGHWYFPLQRIIVAAFLSITAVVFPITWLVLRRKGAK